jgi:GYF domain 2
LVDQHWFISVHGKRYGPYTFAALTEAAVKGVITPDTNVWRLGWKEWHPASDVPGLIAQPPADPAADDEAEEAPDAPASLDEDTAEVADEQRDATARRGEARRRDRRPQRDEDVPSDTSRAPSRRPPQEDEDDRDEAPRSGDKRPQRGADARDRSESARDEDAGRPRGRRPARDLDEDLDAVRPRDLRATEDDTFSDAPSPRGRRPSRDDAQAPRPRQRPRQDDEEDASLDTPSRRDRRPAADLDRPADKARQRRPLRALEEDAEEPVEGWGHLDVRPSEDDDAVGVTPRSGRDKPSKPASADLDIAAVDAAPSRPSGRETPPKPAGMGRLLKRAAVLVLVILVLAGAGYALFRSGLIALVEPGSPKPAASVAPGELAAAVSAQVAANGLPATVANLPAVVALQRNDPASFDRFKRRFAIAAANAPEEELLSLARAALRKSVKRLLANSSGDTLLEITEAYLAYMQGLQTVSPESCVALSDESKGAKLTSNLAKQFPIQFIRDMSVLERVASTSTTAAVTPLTADQARPYLETVFNNLRQQSVKSELLGRDKLSTAEFEPYCTLVIAFYQAVLAMPRDDKINLLRYLYASAATDPDSDLAK